MKFVIARMLAAFALLQSFSPNANADRALVIQDIECRGNVIAACSYIRDRLNLSAGTQVDEEEIDNAKLRLSSLPRFTSVDIYLEKGAEKGRVVVVVEVVEADPITKESAIGTSARFGGIRQAFAGRIGNENLFGTGKVLSLDVGGGAWISGFSGEGYRARIQYADPQPFASSRYYLIGGVTYLKDNISDSKNYLYGRRLEVEYVGVDLRLGRRLFDFSYFAVGYQVLPVSTVSDSYLQADGSSRIYSTAPHGILFFDYGWNSEDDPYFPTRGSRFNIQDGYDQKIREHYFSIGLRKTWKTATNSTWTLKLGIAPGAEFRSSLGENLPYGFAYSRPISARDGFGGVQRGRWYIEPSFAPGGYRSNGDHLWELGVKAGVRLDTKAFGLIDLYVIGSNNSFSTEAM